jgi:hypothetical protein
MRSGVRRKTGVLAIAMDRWSPATIDELVDRRGRRGNRSRRSSVPEAQDGYGPAPGNRR